MHIHIYIHKYVYIYIYIYIYLTEVKIIGAGGESDIAGYDLAACSSYMIGNGGGGEFWI